MKRAVIFIVIGFIMLASAAALLLFDEKEGYDAAEISEEILETLENDMLSDMKEGYSEPNGSQAVEASNGTVPSRIVNGVNVIGVISVPSVGIEVPVAADWSYKNLKKSACRYSGSADTGGFIVLAHNYRRHFGNLTNSSIGDEVQFMDVNGVLYRYRITKKETLGKYELDALTETDDDLTLFTCTPGGAKRVTIRCEKVTDE